jgi:hypothetical protein
MLASCTALLFAIRVSSNTVRLPKPDLRTGLRVSCLPQLLVLGVVAAGMARHTLLGHWVLVRLLLLLEVALVVERGLGRHVCLRHGVVVGRHAAWLAGRDLGVLVLGRVDGVILDAVPVAAGGLGRIQAGLRLLATRCANGGSMRVPGSGSCPRAWSPAAAAWVW